MCSFAAAEYSLLSVGANWRESDMSTTIMRDYKGGTLEISDVDLLSGETEISTGDEQLIDQYIQFLDELNILGDIIVAFHEVKNKFSS